MSKSESYNTISNKWLWHYWRSQECMSTQAHQQFLCQQTLPTKCVNYFWGNKSYLNKECRHILYQKKFCQQILSSKSHNQIASTNCVSSNKVDKLYINKFCQQIMPTNPDNQLCRTEQPAQHNSEMFLVFKKSDWCKLRLVNSQSAANLARMHRGGHGSGR